MAGLYGKTLSLTGEDIGSDGLPLDTDEAVIDSVVADTTPETQQMEDSAEILETTTDGLGELDDMEAGVQEQLDSGEPITAATAEQFGKRFAFVLKKMGMRETHATQLHDAGAVAAFATLDRLKGENFSSGTSASLKRNNLSLIGEGIKDVAKDVLAKLREYVKIIKEKAIAFWNKHFSSLNRIETALNKMKTKVGDHPGKMASSGYEDKAPSSLADAFPTTGGIEKSLVSGFIKVHESLTGAIGVSSLESSVNKIANVVTSNGTQATPASIKQAADGLLHDITNVLSGNVTLAYGVKLSADVGGKTDTEDFEIRLEKEVDNDKDPSAGISVLNKDGAKELLNSVIKVIRDTIKIREKQHKINEAVSKNMDKLYNEIEKTHAPDKKSLRFAARSMYKVMAFTEKLIGTVFNSNVRLAKAVAGYVKFSMARWKSA